MASVCRTPQQVGSQQGDKGEGGSSAADLMPHPVPIGKQVVGFVSRSRA